MEKFLETLGSVTRIRLLKLLMKRTRCLAELSSLLGVSPQAVLKHLKLLEKLGMVSFLTSDGSLGSIKNLYSLDTPIYLSIDKWEGLVSVNVVKKEIDEEKIPKDGIKLPRREAYERLSKIDYEKYKLKRKLKSIREKQIRITKEIFDLEKLQKEIMKKADYSNLEEILMCTYLCREYEQITDICKYFGLDSEEVERILKDLTKINSK